MKASIVFALCLASSSLACFVPAASLKDVETEHGAGGGTARIVEASPDQAYACAAKSLEWEGAERLEEHRERGNVLAELAGMGPRTVCGAWVEPSGADHARITVVTKRATRTVNTALTEDTFHDDISKCLAIAKTGKPLPARKP